MTPKQRQKANFGRVHAIIPDVQVRPGVPTEHLTWIGNYLAEKQPDVIIQIGDFADMPSLNKHALGTVDMEGQRYTEDINATHRAMNLLMAPIKAVRGYHPDLHLTMGNHEERIKREADSNPIFQGQIALSDLNYEKWGWRVHPFLKIAKIDKIEYVHYFTSGVMGRPVSSAAAILRERHCSGVMGHVQHCDIALHKKSGHIAIQCGICYLHDEKYLTPQGNTTRRQIVMLHEVRDGIADPMLVSLSFLKAKYS